MSELVEVGRVGKAHGIKGEVAVYVSTDHPEQLAAGAEVVRAGKAVTIQASRPHQGRLLVKFDDVPDRNTAETLRGQVIEAESVASDDDEFFHAHDLVGLHVLGADGTDLGEVVEITFLPDAAGYDLLEVIHPDGHRWLLPTADDLVEAVETDEGLALALTDPPDGLVFPADADRVPAPPKDATPEAATPEGEA